METYGFQWNLSRNFAQDGFVAFPEVQDMHYEGCGERYSLCYGIQQMISRRKHPVTHTEHFQQVYPQGGARVSCRDLFRVSTSSLAEHENQRSLVSCQADLTHFVFSSLLHTNLSKPTWRSLTKIAFFWRGRTAGYETAPAAYPLLSRLSLHLSDVKKSLLCSLLMGRVTWEMHRVLLELPLRLY